MKFLDTTWARGLAAALLLSAGLANAKTTAEPQGAMLAFDAIYIPALSDTTNGGKSAEAGTRAIASMQRLTTQWPKLRTALAPAWPKDAAWARSLDAAQRQIAQADAAVQRRDWSAAHEALEDVRIVMMKARQAHGMSYYVDGLTQYHEPMEVLALAGITLKPEQLTPAKRQELDQAYAHARALWREIEGAPIDAQQLALTPAREKQLRQGLADETAALSRLSQALRVDDNAALLKAAAAIKPPFARVFTAFGLAEGEAPNSP